MDDAQSLSRGRRRYLVERAGRCAENERHRRRLRRDTGCAAGWHAAHPALPAKSRFSVRKRGALAGRGAAGARPRRATTATTGGRSAAIWSSTDDAYVGARNATLSPKVSGYVSDVAVDDNAHVKAGDVIARIDDGDYRLAVQTANDQIAVQQATIERLGKQMVAQQAAVDQAKAQLASAKAGATRADLELKRQQDLATRQINSRQQLEQAQANYDQAVAAVQARAGRRSSGARQRRCAEGPAGRGRSARSSSCRPRWPRPSATSRSRSSARPSTA